MTRTSWQRTMAPAARVVQRPRPEQHASGVDWETMAVFEVEPPTLEPWHAAVYATADVDDGVTAQLRFRSSRAASSTAGGWSVSGGKIIDKTGSEFITGGVNGGAPVALGQFGSSAGEYVAWSNEGYPQFTLSPDIWPGDTNVVSSVEVFPGGHINGGRYWSNETGVSGNWADIPDRVYSLTGVRSADAIAKGIAAPTDHWHCGLYRMVCFLRSGALTWEAGQVADTVVPEYIERAQELVALGLTVAVEDHDMTGTNPVLPAGLIADPMIAVTGVTDGPIRDLLKLIDAFATAFPGANNNAWFCLPNEPYTTGITTDYTNFVVTLCRRLRGKGFGGIISIPLARFSQDLRVLGEGGYNSLITTLTTTHGISGFAWEWHQYGQRWTSAGVSTVGTYAQWDADLALCRSNGRAVWMAEYGQATPTGTGVTGNDAAEREAVLIMATSTYGQALGAKHKHICPTWWALADHTFDRSYSLTYGAANKGNQSGPDPNTTGASKGTYPPWDVTSAALRDEWLTPGGRAHWDLAHDIFQDPLSQLAGVTPGVPVVGFARNIRIGFEGLPAGRQLLYVEGRRVTGAGGVRLIDAKASLTSAPPWPLITGNVPLDPGGGGGGTPVTASDVRSTFISDTESTTFTILPAWLPGVQAGDKIVLIGAGPGPTDAASVTYSFPGTPLGAVAGGTYNPRVKVTVADYDPAGWTVSSSHNFRSAAVCLKDTVGVAISSFVQAFSPANPAGVAHAANALGLVVNVLNYTSAAVSAPTTTPGTHTTIIATPLVPRQIHIAKIPQLTAGTYDPGVATFSGGSEESTVFSLVAQPTALAGAPAAPTVPTFNAGTAITLNTLGADIAAAVAAQPPGTHFQLISGTYTNWSNVRPKTGNHFKGPAAGTAVLSGTGGKVWAFRAINATGSSDDVTISGPVGSIRVENYGAGTTRAEYGAIQAQPTDTSVGSSEYTYGVAQRWFVQGVELKQNSANGYRMSDYGTAYQVTSYGHGVTGIGADRCVGGLIHTCTLEANGLTPAGGVNSNGANIKVTFHNASGGRSQVLPSGVLRSKAPLQIVNSTFNATRSGISGTCQIGFWADLDCQLVEVWTSTFTNHPGSGIFVEGGNNGLIKSNTVTNSDGYGPAFGGDFMLGAITLGETTNYTVEGNTIADSDYALVNRMSCRAADWYNSNNASFANFAWPSGPRYWITADTGIPGVSDQANMWTGANTYRGNILTNCNRVVINEGTNAGGMNTQGSTPLNTLSFVANNYTGSGSLLFYDRSNTGINLTAWRALPYLRDQP